MSFKPYTNKDVQAGTDKQLFTVMSTFAGAGGSSTGYKLAGGKVLVSNEFVEHAYESYKLNNPNTEVLTGDIKDLTPEHFLDAGNIKPGELDIFDGSPPCTHFSMSGKRERSWNKEKLYHGHKQYQIERLTEEMIRVAEGVKPKCIIIENVKALSLGSAAEYRNTFLNLLNKAGYICSWKILNASDYGVPQARERTFIIGIRNDVADALDISEFANDLDKLFPIPNDKRTTLWDGIFDLQNRPEHREAAKLKEKKLADGNPVVKNVLKRIPFNPPKQIQFCKPLAEMVQEEIDKKYRGEQYDEKLVDKFADDLAKDMRALESVGEVLQPRLTYFNYFRCSYDKPAPTITGRAHSYFLPDSDRTFTKEELLRIMSLPDDFKFAEGKIEDIEERIGLMVAPLQMKAISQNLYENVLKPYRTKQEH